MGQKTGKKLKKQGKRLKKRKNGLKADFELVYDVHFPLIEKLGKWIINIPPFSLLYNFSVFVLSTHRKL